MSPTVPTENQEDEESSLRMKQNMLITKLIAKIIRILLDSTTDLDLPLEMAATSNYCATLGHKVILDMMVMHIMVLVMLDVMVILMVAVKSMFWLFLF